MNTRLIRLSAAFFLALLIFPTFARANTAQDLLTGAQRRYEDLLSNEKRRCDKSLWLAVISSFDAVIKQCPDSDEAARALFTKGCIYREMFNYSITMGELYTAENTFNAFIKKYPSHMLVPDAKKNLVEIKEQKKKNNLILISSEKAKPNTFPGRDTALGDIKTFSTKTKDTGKKDTTKNTGTKTPTTTKTPETFPRTPATIEKIRYFTDTSHTRIVVDMDNVPHFCGNILPKDDTKGIPPRIYIDFFGVKAASTLNSSLVVKDGLVSRIRWSKTGDVTVRVVLDLERGADYRVFSLIDPHRLVIDVAR